ncbi:hypothetical protein TNCV_3186661 [Trichonephila clavipes]|nr:hypothetical protein TNCV_3186661 [Trichonephila clavipes]
MGAVNFLHHENPPNWAGIEPATLCTEGQRQTNYATQKRERIYLNLFRRHIYLKRDESMVAQRTWPRACSRRVVSSSPRVTEPQCLLVEVVISEWYQLRCRPCHVTELQNYKVRLQ